MSRSLTKAEIEVLVATYSEKVKRHQGMQVLVTETGKLRIDVIVVVGADKPPMTGAKKDRFALFLKEKEGWDDAAFRFYDMGGHGRCLRIDLIKARSQFRYYIDKAGWG